MNSEERSSLLRHSGPLFSTRLSYPGRIRGICFGAGDLRNLATVELGASGRPRDTIALSLTQINVSASALNELN